MCVNSIYMRTFNEFFEFSAVFTAKVAGLRKYTYKKTYVHNKLLML